MALWQLSSLDCGKNKSVTISPLPLPAWPAPLLAKLAAAFKGDAFPMQ